MSIVKREQTESDKLDKVPKVTQHTGISVQPSCLYLPCSFLLLALKNEFSFTGVIILTACEIQAGKGKAMEDRTIGLGRECRK